MEVDIFYNFFFFNFFFYYEPSQLIWFGFEVTAGTAMRGVFHIVSL